MLPLDRRAYAERSRALKLLGYRNYEDYLLSDTWARIRGDQLEKSPDCYGCGYRATQVHHGRYTVDILSGNDRRHLYSVCDGCHELAEFDEGRKVGPSEATVRLKRRRRVGCSTLGVSNEPACFDQVGLHRQQRA